MQMRYGCCVIKPVPGSTHSERTAVKLSPHRDGAHKFPGTSERYADGHH